MHSRLAYLVRSPRTPARIARSITRVLQVTYDAATQAAAASIPLAVFGTLLLMTVTR